MNFQKGYFSEVEKEEKVWQYIMENDFVDIEITVSFLNASLDWHWKFGAKTFATLRILNSDKK